MFSNERRRLFLTPPLSSVILRYPPYISVQNFAPHRLTSPTSPTSPTGQTKKLCPILLPRQAHEGEARSEPEH